MPPQRISTLRYVLVSMLFLANSTIACETTIVEGDTVKKVNSKLECLSSENSDLHRQLEKTSTALANAQATLAGTPNASVSYITGKYGSPNDCKKAVSTATQMLAYKTMEMNDVVFADGDGYEIVFECGVNGVVTFFISSAVKNGPAISGPLKAVRDILLTIP